MPILQSLENKQRIYIPSTKVDQDGNPVPEDQWGWVVMDVSPYVTRDISNIERLDTEVKAGIDMLCSRIKEWNFTDADDTPLKITKENIELLEMGDFNYLQSQIEKGKRLTDDEKKASTSTSLPVQTIENLTEKSPETT